MMKRLMHLTTVLPLPIWAMQEKMQLLFSLAYFSRWDISSTQCQTEFIQKDMIDYFTERGNRKHYLLIFICIYLLKHIYFALLEGRQAVLIDFEWTLHCFGKQNCSGKHASCKQTPVCASWSSHLSHSLLRLHTCYDCIWLDLTVSPVGSTKG